MTIDDAIETLEDYHDDLIDALDYNQQDALKLGSEAMKFIRSARGKGPVGLPDLLPGETK